MYKHELLQRLIDNGIIAVIRANDIGQARKICQAVIDGGIVAVEVTMTVPGALEVLKELRESFGTDELLLGAGTVLDTETARAALLAGAEYIVTPYLIPDVIQMCLRYQRLCIPGAMTIKEVAEAIEAGGDIIKFFPANVLGVGFVKALRGPLPQARVVPTGGISLDNVVQWLEAGCVAVGVGEELTKGSETGDYAGITQIARQLVARVGEFRRSGSAS